MRPKNVGNKLCLNKQTIAHVNLGSVRGGTGTNCDCFLSYLTPEYDTGCACYETTPNFSCGCVSNACGTLFYSCDANICEEPF